MSKAEPPAGTRPPDVPFETTIEVRDSCLCLHVQRAARALARHYDEALRPHGLTNGQFSLMMSLNRPEPPLIGSVADLLAMDRTTITAKLKPLIRRGLVRDWRDDGDRRGRRLALTDDGLSLLAKALPIWRDTQRRFRLHIGPEKDADLLAALRNLGEIE